MIHFSRPRETPSSVNRNLRPRTDIVPGTIPVVTGQGGRGQGRGRAREDVQQGRGRAENFAQLQPMWRAPDLQRRGWRSARGNRGNAGQQRNLFQNSSNRSTRFPVEHGRVLSNRDPR